MDGMGTINFEEVKINTIISKKEFEIKMKNDLIYFGSFSSSEKNRTVYIISEGKKHLVNIDDLVEVYPIKNNFWSRTSGNFSLGFNTSKGSKTATLALSGNLDYRKEKAYFSLNWDGNNTYQSDTLNSSNSNISLSWQRLLKKGWSTQTVFGTSQNTELGTKMRWELDLMGVKDIAYNSWNRLYAGGGLSFTREISYGDASTQNDMAGIIQLVWKVYKFTSPKINVDANITYLPYFTDGNRYRTSFNFTPNVSVFSDDFKIGLSFYYNYDSDPPSNEASSTNDYGLNLQLTYSLH